MEVVSMKDRWLRAINVERGRAEYGDAIVRGLRMRVSSRSKKWSVVTRKNGRLVRCQLGEFPIVGILEARKKATEFIDAHAASDNTGLQSSKVDTEEHDHLPTVEELCAAYVANMVEKGQPSARSYKRGLIEGEYSFCRFLATQSGHPHRAVDVTRDHVVEWLRRTFQRSPAHARHYRSYLHAAFAWGMKADFDYTSNAERKTYGIRENPVAATPTGPKAKARNRVLSEEEIKQYWDALPDYTSARALAAMRMVISMGGLRITEITSSKKEWYEEGWLRLPTTKNQKEHIVPLTEHAKTQYALALACSTPRSEYLFSNRRDVTKPITVTALSKLTRDLIADRNMAPFQPKDLRRTFKTILLDKGLVGEREIDIWHNHGQNSDVARKHYTWAEFREIKVEVARQIDTFLNNVLAN